MLPNHETVFFFSHFCLCRSIGGFIVTQDFEMKEESSLAYDLESLKIAAREARQRTSDSQALDHSHNRTDLVHAGYRILQCTAAGVTFIFHLIDAEYTLTDLWDYAFVLIYPFCFVSSLVLAVTRIMNVIPNPKPFIPLIISAASWALMLTGAVMAMKHANEELDVNELSDQQLAENSIFRHDLLLCEMSLVGSSLYLVHAWICFDCWRWDRKRMKMAKGVPPVKKSNSTLKSGSDSGMSSTSETETNDQSQSRSMAVPGTSGSREDPYESGNRKSKLMREHERQSAVSEPPEQTDPLSTLNEILQDSVQEKKNEDVKNVQDEPVILHCCCLDFANMIKNQFRTNVPIHEFQVIRVM